jgi:chromosome segregation ATPase
MFVRLHALLLGHSIWTAGSADISSPTHNDTTGKFERYFWDILKQESLVRFSMMQKMELFTMDIIEIKRNNNLLNDKVDALTKEQEAATERNSVLEKENEQLRQQVTALQAETAALNTTEKKMKNEMKRNNTLIMGKLEALTKEQEITTERNSRLEKENAKLKQQISVLQEETTALYTTEQNLKNELKRNNTLVMSKLDVLEEEQKAANEENERLRQDISVLQENNIALNTNEMNWKNVSGTHDAEITDLQNIYGNLRNDMVEIRESFHNVNQRLDNLNASNIHLVADRVNGK